MAIFKAIPNTPDNIEKCLTAIQNAFFAEQWLSTFVERARKQQNLSCADVLCSWWSSIKLQSVNWQYIKTFNNTPAYYYEDYTGRLLHIAEDNMGKSKVYHITGFNDVEEKLNGLSTEELYDNIERYVECRFPDNIELQINEKIK